MLPCDGWKSPFPFSRLESSFSVIEGLAAQRNSAAIRLRNMGEMSGLPLVLGAKNLADGFQFEHRVQIPRAAHGSLGLDQGIQREHPHFMSVDLDGFAPLQALGIPPNPLDFSQAVQLTPVCGKIKVDEPARLCLFFGKRNVRRYEVNRMKFLQSPEEPQQVVRIHPACDIQVLGHPCAAVRHNAISASNDNLNFAGAKME